MDGKALETYLPFILEKAVFDMGYDFSMTFLYARIGRPERVRVSP